MEYTVKQIAENIWAIEQPAVRAFLLAGPDNAILVDTCMGGDLLRVCREITDKPITLLTTHADPDHIGSDPQFSQQHLHSAEFETYTARSPHPLRAEPMEEGDVFSVGDYALEVIHIPGHTPGSVALLDRKHRFLISGDTVQTDCIYMYGQQRNLQDFRSSIAKLLQLRQAGLFNTLYPSHGDVVVTADILEDHLILADEVLSGTAVPVGPAPDWFPDTVKTYRHGRAQMFSDGV